MSKKLLLAAAGLSLLVASPAFAQWVYDPAPYPTSQAQLGYAASADAYAQAPETYVRTPRAYERDANASFQGRDTAVYAGHVVGADPDPNVRLQLQKDSMWNSQDDF